MGTNSKQAAMLNQQAREEYESGMLLHPGDPLSKEEIRAARQNLDKSKSLLGRSPRTSKSAKGGRKGAS